MSLRDGTMAALEDALYVAPAVETGDILSSLNQDLWFYVFDYQSKASAYKQRQGAVHGEMLKYVFGLPLTNPTQFSEMEASLSRLVMSFWGNFIANGYVNEELSTLEFM